MYAALFEACKNNLISFKSVYTYFSDHFAARTDKMRGTRMLCVIDVLFDTRSLLVQRK